MKNKVIEKIAMTVLVALLFSLVAFCVSKRISFLKQQGVDAGLGKSDYGLVSITARSNATHFGKPPEGYSIVCDDRGNFSVSVKKTWSSGGNWIPELAWLIRTNEAEALIAAWRYWEIDNAPYVPSPVPSHGEWKTCDSSTNSEPKRQYWQPTNDTLWLPATFETVVELSNAVFIRFGSSVVLNVSGEDWNTLLKEFPERVETNNMTFMK